MEAFIPLLVFLSVYYFRKQKLATALIFASLIIMAIYTLCPLIFLLLVSYFIDCKKLRDRIYIIITAILIGIYFGATVSIILPILGNVPFKPGSISWFPYLGRSVSEIIFNVILSPNLVVQSTVHDWQLKLIYWILLSVPVAFLYIRSLRSLIPLSYWIAISWLSASRPFYVIGWQYTLIPLPFIYLGSIDGFQKLRCTKIHQNIKRIILVLSLLQIAISPLNPITYNNIPSAGYDNELVIPPRCMGIRNLINDLNSQETVILTTNNIFPHLAHRIHTYVWLPSHLVPEYIVIDISNIGRIYDKIGNRSFIMQVKQLLTRYKYGIYALKGGVLFLKVNYTKEPRVLEPYKMKFNYKYIFCHVPKYELNFRSNSLVILSCTVNDISKPVWFGPYTILIPGKYLLKIRLNLKSCPENLLIEVVADKGRTTIAKFHLDEMSLDIESNGWLIATNFIEVDSTYTEVEIRAWSSIKCNLALDYIELEGPLRM